MTTSLAPLLTEMKKTQREVCNEDIIYTYKNDLDFFQLKRTSDKVAAVQNQLNAVQTTLKEIVSAHSKVHIEVYILCSLMNEDLCLFKVTMKNDEKY